LWPKLAMWCRTFWQGASMKDPWCQNRLRALCPFLISQTHCQNSDMG
jgi:hypothetical protein